MGGRKRTSSKPKVPLLSCPGEEEADSGIHFDGICVDSFNPKLPPKLFTLLLGHLPSLIQDVVWRSFVSIC